ncbi:MAG: SDR family oxidoreductase [Planctomycetes bacterium]|nr:SDR family oxidoreductase [Planctomycetota bacterium]
MEPTEQPFFLILGGGGGIGSALARELHARGAALCLAGRDRQRLESAGSPLGAELAVLDARHFDEVQDLVRELLERRGRVDGIACCVGSIPLKPAHATSEQELREALEQNLFSAFAAVRAAGALLRERPASVALVSSVAASVGLANHEAIAAAKAGVEALARSAAATYVGRSLRVNAVAPGLVRTPLAQRLLANPALEKASAALHPLGRVGEPEEIARVLAWLLSAESSWVTGQVIHVDGGLSTLRSRA